MVRREVDLGNLRSAVLPWILLVAPAAVAAELAGLVGGTVEVLEREPGIGRTEA